MTCNKSAMLHYTCLVIKKVYVRDLHCVTSNTLSRMCSEVGKAAKSIVVIVSSKDWKENYRR